MIKVTRVSGEEFVINAEKILYVEQRGDTIITLDGRERLIVKESADEVVQRVIEYARALRTFPPERITG